MVDCRFETERLVVRPWREALAPDARREFVVDLLTPAVTATLPPEWHGEYDDERAAAWADERDAESTPLLVTERGGVPVGLLIVAETEVAQLHIGYLFAEHAWGRGLATELVGGLVEWCRSSTDVRTIAGGVGAGNDASMAVLRRNGFEAVGEPVHGEYTLRRAVGSSTRIRPETAPDHAAIRRVVVAAFGSEAEGDLVDRIRSSPEYVPAMALLAEIDGEVVGHVMVSGALVRHASGDRPIIMLSPLAVAPPHQRRGVGAALVEAVCVIADRRGEPVVVLEGSPDYYRRFGFEAAAEHGLSLPLPDWAPAEAGQVKRLSGYDATDPTLCGEVVYPAAFDGLD